MDEKILSKIQKLLCLAADNPDGHESKLAAERAAEMMAKYDIGIEDIKKDGSMADGGIVEENVTANSKQHQAWESELAGVLCDCFDCKRLISYADGGEVRVFVGAKSDVKILVWFYKYLRLRIAKTAEMEFRLQKDQKMFGIGAVRALRPRLEALYKKKTEVVLSASRALVVNKQLAVNNFFDHKYSGLRKKSHNVGNGSRAAWNSGTAAGQSMSINQQLGG
jgi:hypothetical protein